MILLQTDQGVDVQRPVAWLTSSIESLVRRVADRCEGRTYVAEAEKYAGARREGNHRSSPHIIPTTL